MKTQYYSGKKVLITGGLGFLGSNLAHALVQAGAQVTIIDDLNPLYGGNMFNIHEIQDKVKVINADVSDLHAIQHYAANHHIIFHFAAQVSHIDGQNMPFDDLEINCRGFMNILETCKHHNDDAKIVFASSRLVLGKIIENPITENHPVNPLSLYGVHKLAAEKYAYLYHKLFDLRTTVLRISNPYGIRQQIKHNKYSIPGWFMRQAMEHGKIKIFGDGQQLRDYIYVDDITEAFVLAGATDVTDGKLYNCGYGQSVSFKTMVETIVNTVGSGEIEYTGWPKDYEKEETGDCEMDISKLHTDTGWQPSITLSDGIQRMCEYYKQHWDQYVVTRRKKTSLS